MTKQEQIEEMAKVIRPILENRTDICFIPDLDKPIAEELLKHYQPKLPKDSVVLSREEFKNYCNLSVENEVLKEEKEQFENDVCNYEMNLQHLTGELEQVRKETAEKILDLLVPDCKVCDENWHSGCLCLRATLAEKIAKQFDIEIKK